MKGVSVLTQHEIINLKQDLENTEDWLDYAKEEIGELKQALQDALDKKENWEAAAKKLLTD